MPSVLNSRLRNSVSFRLAFLFCLTFSLGIGAAFLATYLRVGYSLEASSKEVIASKVREISTVLATEGIPGLKTFLSDEKNRILDAPFMVRVLVDNGDTIYLKPSVQEKQFDFDGAFKQKTPAESLLGWHSLEAINDEDRFDMLTEKVGNDLYLQVGKSSEDREEVLGTLLVVFLVSGLMLIFVSGGLGLFYARRSLKPLRELLAAMQDIESGRLDKRVLVGSGQGEIQELASTFNRMSSRIEKLVQIMRESLDNVAHDIRTPLTRIRAVAEDALLAGKPEFLKYALEDCAETSSELSGLVDQLLSISEAEAGTLRLKSEHCDVRLLLYDVAEIYEFVALEKEIELTVDVAQPELNALIDRKRIKQVIGNLVDNAVKFSPEKANVCISAKKTKSQLEISVSDNGSGIPEDEITRIWDRLYRADKSRSTKGSGIGLSIVKSIVEAHRGSVDAHRRPEGGMRFTVHLPLLEAAE